MVIDPPGAGRSDEQIAFALKRAETGTPGDPAGGMRSRFSTAGNVYGSSGVGELWQLRLLEEG